MSVPMELVSMSLAMVHKAGVKQLVEVKAHQLLVVPSPAAFLVLEAMAVAILQAVAAAAAAGTAAVVAASTMAAAAVPHTPTLILQMSFTNKACAMIMASS